MIRRGFTLIELLVVIAIIGLLSAVVLASLQDARARGRDAQRIAALTEVRNALELYFATHNEYPKACGRVDKWRGYNNCPTTYIDDLVPEYLPQLPVDPLTGVDGGFQYKVSSNQQDYKLMIYHTVETKEVVPPGDPNSRCAASCVDSFCSENSFARYSPGASCW